MSNSIADTNILYSDFYENWMMYLDGLTLEEFFKYKNDFECIKILYFKSISDFELETLKNDIVYCVSYIKKDLNMTSRVGLDCSNCSDCSDCSN